MVDIYADEGISGTSRNKRDEFNRMMRDCKAGKVDCILVKSVSRFARNSLECIDAVRELKRYGTTVLFENDGIDSNTMNHELVLYIKGAFAQDEAMSTSKRVKRSNQMRMENGQVYPYPRLLKGIFITLITKDYLTNSITKPLFNIELNKGLGNWWFLLSTFT